MATILSATRQQERLDSVVQETLDNFSMTRHLANLLIQYENAKLPAPSAVVNIIGPIPAHIPGTNCGFFVLPVIRMAVLDCRRSLEFFGLTCDHNTHRLVPIRGRRPDDLGIENFGLPLVTPAQFISAVSALVSIPPEPIFLQVHDWSNKQLAHFTQSEPVVMIPAIRDMAKMMIEAYMSLLFVPLGRPRPAINPTS